MELKSTEVLVLRCCEKDFTSYRGFKYPEKGYVEAPDWREDVKCGGGLHGLLWGCGDYELSNHGSIWQLVKVDISNGFIDLGDKVKFRCGEVILSSLNSIEVLSLLQQYVPDEYVDKISYNVQINGNNSIQKSGCSSIQKSGHLSKQDAGNSSTQITGCGSKQIGGAGVVQNSGGSSIQISKFLAIQYSGNDAAQISGDFSVQKAWDNSTQITGENSVSIISGRGDSIYRGGRNSRLIFIGAVKAYMVGVDCEENDTLYITDKEIQKIYKHTPENITELEKHEVFVFGSNLAGNHAGGAARAAVELFGAKDGEGIGAQGQSYALPTMDEQMQPLTINQIAQYADDFIKYACKYTRTIFYLTKVGCGIAGFSEDEIKPLFAEAPANVIKPLGW
jgi:hypothetical protein